MKTAEIPANEQARLATLRSLNMLDTPPEERFDRLTRLAKRMFNVPISVLSLTDENRLWLKSCAGIAGTEAPRDTSFCGHVINQDGLLIIPDAKEDARFADNPAVLGDPYVRFYAGCPLKAPDGHKMGTLCIVDTKPRKMEKEEFAALEDLAAMAENELAAVQLATMDDLTSILNRRGFLLFAQHSLAFCARQALPASLVFLDLDNFKIINDTCGHAEGDRVLADFARLLKTAFRESDCYGRIGGDEFAVFLTDTTKQQAESTVLRFGELLDKYNKENNRSYVVGHSHGIVEFDNDKHPSIATLLVDGDSVMYEVKKTRR